MRCLVTGHQGYIGSHLHAKLKDLGHEVLGIDLKDGKDINSNSYGLEEGGKFHPFWFNFKPEYIFHLACWPRVAYSVENPVETMKNNVLSTSNVLNFARKVGCKRVIYSSSSSVAGNNDGLGPTSPYGLQKLISELECRLYSQLYGLDTVSLRYFNVYSEDQPADGPYTTAIANFMEFIRQGKQPFITGNGSQRRDMIHVDDVVSANIFVMEHPNDFTGASYDVGTGENISLNEITEIVNYILPNVEFQYVKGRAGDVLETKANVSALKQIGWESKTKISKGIADCFKQLRRK